MSFCLAFKRSLLVIAMGSVTSALTYAQTPSAPEVPYQETIGIRVWSDSFHWMNTHPNETPKPHLLSYIDEENKYCRAWMIQHDSLRKKLLAEFKKTEPSLYFDNAPQRVDEFEIRTEGLKVTRYDSLTKQKTVLFNGSSYFPNEKDLIEDFRVSPSFQYLALYFHIQGKAKYYLYDRNKKSLTLIPTPFESSTLNLEWLPDESGFYYAINSAIDEESQLYFYSLAEKKSELIKSLSRAGDEFEIHLSQDQQFIMISEKSYSHRESYALPVHQPHALPQLILEAAPLRFTFADHDENGFIVQTNLSSDFYSLYQKQGDELKLKILGSNERDIESFESHDHFYWITRRNELGLAEIEVVDKNFATLQSITFKDSYFNLLPIPERNYHRPDETVHFLKHGVLAIEERFQYSLKQGLKKLSNQRSPLTLEGDYSSQRITYSSTDGTLVPMTLVYKKGTDLKVPHPVFYSAYGSYSTSYDLNYTHGYSAYSAQSLMDRGVVIAISHVRGGGDKGLAWFLGAREKNRIHSLEDFITGAEYLITAGYTEKKRIAISSYSAGGFLVGNAFIKRPDLWSSVLIYMGFTDYVSSMLDPKIPFTVKERDLDGDPSKPQDLAWILPLSPQDNLIPQDYPPLFVWSAMSDPDVSFHEGVKFVAKLRKVQKNSESTLLNVIPKGEGEHDGSFESYLDDVAQSMTFILMHFGIYQ